MINENDLISHRVSCYQCIEFDLSNGSLCEEYVRMFNELNFSNDREFCL